MITSRVWRRARLSIQTRAGLSALSARRRLWPLTPARPYPVDAEPLAAPSRRPQDHIAVAFTEAASDPRSKPMLRECGVDGLEPGFSYNESCPNGRASTIGSAFAPNDHASSAASEHRKGHC
jgi:hypothetical protein